MNSELSVAVRELEHCTVLDLKGDLTKHAEDAVLGLRNWLQGLEGSKRALVLNLSQVPYVNSAGIAVLIRLVRYGTKARFHTYAFGVSSHYQKLFRMVGLTEYMAVYPDEFTVLQRIEESLE
ncbi:STAS domain-containing protein [Paenibacillus thermotolerans]|uniref:STAS domain-containing protein n=1 Tax=Paenibacillus thermotolerans TaxID=3027807 RepID=UPI002368AD45|nr:MULTISPECIES: STAS domain-containing protein [unclassified Paenibacillus]